ncbi:MAG: pantoate--beta-alanine ligase [Leptospirales bacterium]
MEILTTLEQLKEKIPLKGTRSRPVSLVPTMGALHAGHQALIEKAVRENGEVIATVFVNPLQFGPREDFSQYPRTRDNDIALLEQAGVRWAYFPEPSELLPGPVHFEITHPVAERYCGAFRPGHFSGVLTIVSKFFHLINPDRAYFGMKDRQQLFLITQMVRELSFPVEIRPVETVREPDGLALSSRNRYLSPEDRIHAPELYRMLVLTRDRYAPKSHADRLDLPSRIEAQMKERGFRPEYIALVHPESFMPLSSEDPPESPAILLTAAWLGETRLIDNIDIPGPHV